MSDSPISKRAALIRLHEQVVDLYRPPGLIGPRHGTWWEDFRLSGALLGTYSWYWARPGWGMEANVSVRFQNTGNCHNLEPRVFVNWGSTTYSPAGAVAAAKLHHDLAELASLMQTALDDFPDIDDDLE